MFLLKTSSLPGISLQEDRWININKIKVVEKNNEIICMCWGDKEESEVCSLLYSIVSKQLFNFIANNIL